MSSITELQNHYGRQITIKTDDKTGNWTLYAKGSKKADSEAERLDEAIKEWSDKLC